MYDPVEMHFNEKIKINKKSKQDLNKIKDKDITSYMNNDEIEDMENLKNIFYSEKELHYKNIMLIQTFPNAKSYDLAIIKFINDIHYILILFQFTVS